MIRDDAKIITEMTSVNYAVKSILLTEHILNHFVRVSIVRMQKIVSQKKII